MIRSLMALLRFFVFYLLELTKSNIQIAACALSPHYQINPGFVDLPLHTSSDFQTLLLANLITMTPGTISVDVSPDRKTITVHFMFKDQEASQRDKFNQNFYDIFGRRS